MRVIGGSRKRGTDTSTAGGQAGRGGRGEVDAASDLVPVTVIAAQRHDVPVYVSAQGTVKVSPQVGGQLLSVNFRESQAVKKGDLVAQIDARNFQTQCQTAVAPW